MYVPIWIGYPFGAIAFVSDMPLHTFYTHQLRRSTEPIFKFCVYTLKLNETYALAQYTNVYDHIHVYVYIKHSYIQRDVSRIDAPAKHNLLIAYRTELDWYGAMASSLNSSTAVPPHSIYIRTAYRGHQFMDLIWVDCKHMHMCVRALQMVLPKNNDCIFTTVFKIIYGVLLLSAVHMCFLVMCVRTECAHM